LKETEHFCRWLQEKVAKIVQCGEALAREDRTSFASTEHSRTGSSKEYVCSPPFALLSLTACNRLCPVLPDAHCIRKLT
jgi:hypothetical protein